jgi:hypothetical protein
MTYRHQAFLAELEKLSISAGLAHSAMLGRVAQGARIAPGVLQAAERAAVGGARATPAMGGVLRAAGEDVRAIGAVNARANHPLVAGTRNRVEGAIRAEAANPAATRMPLNRDTALSHGYEGYMNTSNSTARYTPQHMGAVMGVNPSQINVKGGPTQIAMELAGAPHPTAGTVPAAMTRPMGNAAAGTVPARRGLPFAPTVPGALPVATVPARRPLAAGAAL